MYDSTEGFVAYRDAPDMTPQLAEDLEALEQVIERNGFYQGSFYRYVPELPEDQYPVCYLGAARIVVQGTPTHTPSGRAHARYLALGQAANVEARFLGFDSGPGWNDGSEPRAFKRELKALVRRTRAAIGRR